MLACMHAGMGLHHRGQECCGGGWGWGGVDMIMRGGGGVWRGALRAPEAIRLYVKLSIAQGMHD